MVTKLCRNSTFVIQTGKQFLTKIMALLNGSEVLNICSHCPQLLLSP